MKSFEFDFDTKNLNIPKIEKYIEDISCPQDLLKIKQIIETKMKQKKNKEDITEDLTEDKMEIKDGQKVKTEAEGDDDDAEGKIRGDPYNQEEKFKKEANGDPSKDQKKEKKKMDMDDVLATLQSLVVKFDTVEKQLQERDKSIEFLLQEKKTQEQNKAHDLREILSQAPYNIPMEDMKEIPLEKLKEQKAFIDKMPMVKDFRDEMESNAFEEHYNNKARITHEDVTKVDFSSMNDQPIDARDLVIRKARDKHQKDTADLFASKGGL